tara:strand:+ start:360 stop:782 length:423 start_codon:yes stop_codon:yes gene_type:complete
MPVRSKVMKLESGKKYKISTKERKRTVILEIYQSKTDPNKKFKRYETFQTGWVVVDGEEGSYYLQDYSANEGVDLYGAVEDEFEFLNGVSDDWEFSESITEEEKEKVKSNWGNLDFINDNWDHEDTEYLFYGELTSQEID